jgi:hypothetical protein
MAMHAPVTIRCSRAARRSARNGRNLLSSSDLEDGRIQVRIWLPVIGERFIFPRAAAAASAARHRLPTIRIVRAPHPQNDEA